MLEGVSGRVIRGIGRSAGKYQERILTREEVKKVLRRMKDKKAVEIDEMPAEI